MPHNSKDYELKHTPGQLTGFTWNLSEGELTISGSCPECAGEIEHPVPDVIPGAVTKGWRRRSTSAEIPDEIYMRCVCAYPHTGDERETGGCGASWVAVRQAAGATP